jgi:hypothetical protein
MVTLAASILEWLRASGLPFQHVVLGFPALTAEDLVRGLEPHTASGSHAICKNLFVRDSKKRSHFLLALPHDRPVKLDSALGARVGAISGGLRLADDPVLLDLLNVTPGSVSPLCLLHDKEAQRVIFFLDREVMDRDLVWVHPCDCNEAIGMAPNHLVTLIESQTNHKVNFLNFAEEKK